MNTTTPKKEPRRVMRFLGWFLPIKSFNQLRDDANNAKALVKTVAAAGRNTTAKSSKNDIQISAAELASLRDAALKRRAVWSCALAATLSLVSGWVIVRPFNFATLMDIVVPLSVAFMMYAKVLQNGYYAWRYQRIEQYGIRDEGVSLAKYRALHGRGIMSWIRMAAVKSNDDIEQGAKK